MPVPAATPFFYANTDPNPPAGVPGYLLTEANVAPALAVWLFLTTNPVWIQMIAANKPVAEIGTASDIGAALGLTPGTVEWIIDLVRESKGIAKSFYKVALQFQKLRAANPLGYVPPFCPSIAMEITQLIPHPVVSNKLVPDVPPLPAPASAPAPAAAPRKARKAARKPRAKR